MGRHRRDGRGSTDPGGGSEPEPGHGHGGGDSGDGGVSSLREVFRERRLSIATMDRPLRLATAGALASLVGVVALIALRDVPGTQVLLGRTAGVVHEIPAPLFAASLVLLSIGFAYFAAGAVFASWQVTGVSLLLLTAVIGLESGAFGAVPGFSGFLAMLPGWAQWVTRGLLVGLWAVPAGLRLVQRRSGGPGAAPRRRLVVLVVYVLLFGGYFGVLALASPSVGGLDLFPQISDLVLFDLVLLVNPILQVAAVDFAEWGALLGQRVAAVGKDRGRWLSVVVAVVSASLVAVGYANIARADRALSLPRVAAAAGEVLICAVALLVMIALGRRLGIHRRVWPGTLNFAAVVVVCAVGAYIIAPLATGLLGGFHPSDRVQQISADGRYTAAADVVSAGGGTAGAAFTVLVPRGWVPTTAGGVNRWSNDLPGPAGTSVGGVEQILVATLPVQGQAAAIATLTGATPAGPQVQVGRWTRVPIAHPGGAALIWTTALPGNQLGVYLLQEQVQGAPLAAVQPLFDALADSFRPAGQAPATLPTPPERTTDPAQGTYTDRTKTLALALTAAAALALLILVGLRGRRWPPQLVAAALLLGVSTLAGFLFNADAVGRTLLGPTTRWPYLSQYGLLIGMGVLAVTAMAVTRRRTPAQRRTLLVGLLGLETAVWTLQGMSVLYQHALAASRISAWAAIIVLVAIAWDITMSGESITNRGSRHLPRHSRVLAFFGYVLMVAATILFYSGQRLVTDGHPAEPIYEPESITQAALFRIAFPLVVLLFLLRFGRPATHTPTEHPTPPATSAAPAPPPT